MSKTYYFNNVLSQASDYEPHSVIICTANIYKCMLFSNYRSIIICIYVSCMSVLLYQPRFA